MKKFIYISFVFLVLLACGKENATTKVRYEASKAFADTEISYRDADGKLVTEWVGFESGEDTWNVDMELNKGEIVYLSAMYQDSASSVKLRILIGGKVYKEGTSINEPEKYLIVSGTVPY